MQCEASHTGMDGCQFPVQWKLRAADKKMYSCGRHLHRVARQMLKTGVEFMTISKEED